MAQAIESAEEVSIASGATDVFATVWTFEAAADVRVYVTVDGIAVLQEQGVAYAIASGDWRNDGADIVFQAGHRPPPGARVTRQRATPMAQPVPFGDDQTFRPNRNEDAFDRLTRMSQDLAAVTARALKVPPGEDPTDVEAVLELILAGEGNADRAEEAAVSAKLTLSGKADRTGGNIDDQNSFLNALGFTATGKSLRNALSATTARAAISAPSQADLTGALALIAGLTAASTAGVYGYATKSELLANTTPTAGQVGYVFADPTPANNGKYNRTISPTWTKVAELSDAQFAAFQAQAEGAGWGWVAQEPTVRGPGQYPRGTTPGDILTLGAAQYARFAVPAGARALRATGSPLGVISRLAVYRDSGGAWIGSEVAGTEPDATDRVNVALTPPAGTAFVDVSSIIGKPLKLEIFQPLPVVDLNAAAVDWLAVDPTGGEAGKYVKAFYSPDMIGVLDPYFYKLYPLDGISDYRVTCRVQGDATGPATFLAADMSFVDTYGPAPAGTVTSYAELDTPYPPSASWLAVSAMKSTEILVERRARATTPLPRLRVVEKAARQAARAPTAGLAAAWMGHSFPAGGDPGGAYPQMAGEILGIRVANEAIGGSTLRAGVSSKRSGADPWGCAGMDFFAFMTSLGHTEAEKIAIIADWADVRPLLTAGNPGDPAYAYPMTDFWKAFYRACAYDVRLIQRHLIDDPKQVIVLDHGANDQTWADDLMTGAGTATTDRGTFIGAANVLIQAIRDKNPHALIVIGQDPRSGGGFDKVRVAQDALAAYWRLPIHRLGDELGWSYDRFATQGGVTKSIAEWIFSGDGQHPHSNPTGLPVRKLAGMWANFLGNRLWKTGDPL